MRVRAALLFLMAFGFLPLCRAESLQERAMFVGGTTEVKAKTRGVLDPDADGACLFKYKDGSLAIAHNTITRVSYAEPHLYPKVHGVVGIAIGVPASPGPRNLFHRYLTVEFRDSRARDQSAIFDLFRVSGSGVRSVIDTLEVRTGKKAVCEDDWACKTLRK